MRFAVGDVSAGSRARSTVSIARPSASSRCSERVGLGAAEPVDADARADEAACAAVELASAS